MEEERKQSEKVIGELMAKTATLVGQLQEIGESGREDGGTGGHCRPKCKP